MKLSVVIPAYNEAGIIEACLESLQQQIRQADEIIVVDNNSTDDTVKIARSFGVTVITESKQGIFAAASTGYNAATGDIIVRCDADCILPPDWLQKIERKFTDNPQLTAVTGPGSFYGTNQYAANFAQIWYMYAYFVLVGLAIARWPLFGSNFAIRRSAWQEVRDKSHIGRIDIHDDIDLSIHLPQTATVAFEPSLIVGISARALQASELKLRYARGLTSLTIHWPDEAPWKRWAHKLRGRWQAKP